MPRISPTLEYKKSKVRAAVSRDGWLKAFGRRRRRCGPATTPSGGTPTKNAFYSGILPDGSFSTEYVDQSNVYALWFGLPGDGPKPEISFDEMESNRPKFDSTYSYFPEVFARYGRNDRAYNGKRVVLNAIAVRGGETRTAKLS